ncbi:hypothetical protein CH63R_01693 [Colletotrichum higginsianum IMI 349063]|uniref:Uncharacterized protein n=1 Tax=Colletotrichum higginsianum (strain IMI 349063) TaxID=759273 RepID=A0A1B7YWT9_COLHI|nr:hypothetical protein CH63R_01693 [Colletotrichum higginsianum IMI 349063]OBR16513.1 hypothetical protein CH63R_01693 [Colletotrichum higginsianum IMI 349063]
MWSAALFLKTSPAETNFYRRTSPVRRDFNPARHDPDTDTDTAVASHLHALCTAPRVEGAVCDTFSAGQLLLLLHPRWLLMPHSINNNGGEVNVLGQGVSDREPRHVYSHITSTRHGVSGEVLVLCHRHRYLDLQRLLLYLQRRLALPTSEGDLNKNRLAIHPPPPCLFKLHIQVVQRAVTGPDSRRSRQQIVTRPLHPTITYAVGQTEQHPAHAGRPMIPSAEATCSTSDGLHRRWMGGYTTQHISLNGFAGQLSHFPFHDVLSYPAIPSHPSRDATGFARYLMQVLLIHVFSLSMPDLTARCSRPDKGARPPWRP